MPVGSRAMARPMSPLAAELGLGEDVGGGGVGLEEADAVFLVEQEVEVAGGVGLDGVELALAGDVEREAGEDELLGAGGLGGGRW